MTDTHTIPEPYRERLTAILQKTYDEHGLKDRPWGLAAKGRCSYAHGCAVGLSLSAAVAAEADRLGTAVNDVANLLRTKYEGGNDFAQDLLGTPERPPQAVITVLETLQTVHDTLAIQEYDGEITPERARREYREELQALARHGGLTLVRA